MVVLIVGVSAAVAIVQHWDYLFPTKLGRQTQYAGLKLGMSPKEVMYIKGFPSTVLGEESTDPTMKGWFLVINTKELEGGKEVTDYANWSYNYDKHNLNVEFDGARTAVIAIQCYSEDKLTRCPSIGDVTDGAKEQDALHKLGSRAEADIDGVTKVIRFSELGVKLKLTQEVVYVLEVYDPKSEP